MRKFGYYFEREDVGELVFSRPISAAGSGYPRFHVYVKVDEVSCEAVINLHLDQKKPIYKGASAHAGEYKGETVEKEAERIKKIFGPIV